MTNNKQQTAVEWLGKELESYGDPQFCEIEWEQLDSLIQQAKEMDKQQKIDAYNQGEFNQGCNGSAEDYIKETYK
jgi:hypothetical protein